ncbi:MAG: hypothetical protein RLY93_02100 [Sumerlaeia bacterium]
MRRKLLPLTLILGAGLLVVGPSLADRPLPPLPRSEAAPSQGPERGESYGTGRSERVRQLVEEFHALSPGERRMFFDELAMERVLAGGPPDQKGEPGAPRPQRPLPPEPDPLADEDLPGGMGRLMREIMKLNKDSEELAQQASRLEEAKRRGSEPQERITYWEEELKQRRELQERREAELMERLRAEAPGLRGRVELLKERLNRRGVEVPPQARDRMERMDRFLAEVESEPEMTFTEFRERAREMELRPPQPGSRAEFHMRRLQSEIDALKERLTLLEDELEVMSGGAAASGPEAPDEWNGEAASPSPRMGPGRDFRSRSRGRD